MKVFLDTSVPLAACGSAKGLIKSAVHPCQGARVGAADQPMDARGSTRNLGKFPAPAVADWPPLREQLAIVSDVVSLDRPLVFAVRKDRPVLRSEFASAQVLLTLDREDFLGQLGSECYGMPILLPSDFLERERAAGRFPRP